MGQSNQHEPNRFTPVVKAMELVDHVLTITDNINKFPDYTIKEKKNEDGTVTMVLVQRQDGLVNRAREQAMQIYTSWKAHAMLGNSYLLLQRMDQFVKELMEEIA